MPFSLPQMQWIPTAHHINYKLLSLAFCPPMCGFKLAFDSLSALQLLYNSATLGFPSSPKCLQNSVIYTILAYTVSLVLNILSLPRQTVTIIPFPQIPPFLTIFSDLSQVDMSISPPKVFSISFLSPLDHSLTTFCCVPQLFVWFLILSQG